MNRILGVLYRMMSFRNHINHRVHYDDEHHNSRRRILPKSIWPTSEKRRECICINIKYKVCIVIQNRGQTMAISCLSYSPYQKLLIRWAFSSVMMASFPQCILHKINPNNQKLKLYAHKSSRLSVRCVNQSLTHSLTSPYMWKNYEFQLTYQIEQTDS